jgi:hypothetical protein
MGPPTAIDVDLQGITAAEYIKRFGDGGRWVYASEEEVRRNFDDAGAPHDGVELIKGLVEETIPGAMPDRIAILRLDTDWYEPTRHELEHLWPRLAPGGVLIVDDYGAWKGSQQATDEFLRDKPELFMHRIDEAARLIVKPRPPIV